MKNNFQLLTLVLSENQSHKCVRFIREKDVLGGTTIIGRGTVSGTLLNLLGIKSQRKDVIHFLLKEEKSEEILDYFDEVLHLSKPGNGIAYTTPIISVVGLPGQETNHEQVVTNNAQCLEGQCMFKKLTVIVDRGLSSDVMDIALKAGVRGGTILHGRGAGAELATNLFGVEIEPEKELVIILLPDSLVDKVVQALTKDLQLHETGKGILFVEPILDTRGLVELID
jgi:nitrogen regulatory protein PII